ncbi:nicotinate-nucleotide diphosphorylase (carboxylating) [Lysobacteraceae bacterium NML08-0793]|nr:nicotinate-nucleotide diphosphorylase (carboxylating) [Xanthomonadaceae bacterium NML08-0793]
MRSPQALAFPDPEQVLEDARRALGEDIADGDVTAALLPDVPDSAYLLCKEDAVIAGRPWFDACHRLLDEKVQIDWRIEEGAQVKAGTVIATLQGRSRALVSAERAALNFLQTLSGTATITAQYVAAVAGSGCKILDTRKTIPGLRLAQKYAVRMGGGHNHRIGLFDAVMLKENHIRTAGSLRLAAEQALAQFPQLPLIIEVETLDELREALQTGCTRILIDDFDAASRREAVRIAREEFGARIPLEVSGGVDMTQIAAIAHDGVDCISIGSLTKHVRAIDLSMKLGPAPASLA